MLDCHAQSPELDLQHTWTEYSSAWLYSWHSGGRRFRCSRSSSATNGVHGQSELFETCLKKKKKEKGRKKESNCADLGWKDLFIWGNQRPESNSPNWRSPEKEWVWWSVSLILPQGGRDKWISNFKISLVYTANFRPARATQKDPASNRTKQTLHHRFQHEGTSEDTI